ncbi:hypothetical protein QBC44DRAFT_361961 [Cladorrhinum sp. PSN332]|nr:hypothetical protein QBC44DRAFT_361961 [Cladorrhinum sp. PSN332]
MSRAGSSSDVSTLDFSLGLSPSQLEAPYNDYVTKDLAKQWKKKYSATKAKIKGQAHPSSSAPEQGKVVSIQLFRPSKKAGKEFLEKVVETIHVLKDGNWITNSDFQKKKKQGGS